MPPAAHAAPGGSLRWKQPTVRSTGCACTCVWRTAGPGSAMASMPTSAHWWRRSASCWGLDQAERVINGVGATGANPGGARFCYAPDGLDARAGRDWPAPSIHPGLGRQTVGRPAIPLFGVGTYPRYRGADDVGTTTHPKSRCCCYGCRAGCCCGWRRGSSSDCCSTTRRAAPGTGLRPPQANLQMQYGRAPGRAQKICGAAAPAQ